MWGAEDESMLRGRRVAQRRRVGRRLGGREGDGDGGGTRHHKAFTHKRMVTLRHSVFSRT